MDERRKKKKTPEEWLWKRNVLSFFSTFNDAFARVEECKRTGRTMDWKTQFSPEWVSCVVLTIIFTRLASRLALAQEMAQYYAPSAGLAFGDASAGPAKLWLTRDVEWRRFCASRGSRCADIV